jgi:hypothetical protein
VVSQAVALRNNQAISYKRLSGLFGEVFGLEISEGALGNLFKRAMPAFAEQVAGIKVRILYSMTKPLLFAGLSPPRNAGRASFKSGDRARWRLWGKAPDR